MDKFTEIIGVLTIGAGAVIALVEFVFFYSKDKTTIIQILRQELGKAILLGLEILVAGDIIGTAVTEPTMIRVNIRSNCVNKNFSQSLFTG